MEDLEIALHMVRSYLQDIIRQNPGNFYYCDFDYRYPILRNVELSKDHHDLAWALILGIPASLLDQINAEFNNKEDQS